MLGLRDFADLVGEMQRAYDESWPQTRPQPPVDIRVDEGQVTLALETPGVARDDLELEVDGRHLTVRGKKAEPEPADGEKVCYRERRFGDFERTFELGFSIDRDRIAADYRHGVLTITLPKTAQAQPRRIEVRAS